MWVFFGLFGDYFGPFWDYHWTTLRLFWDHFLTILGPFWDYFETNFFTLLGLSWNHFGTIWGPFWDHFGTILGPFWNHFGTILGLFWDYFGTILGPLFLFCLFWPICYFDTKLSMFSFAPSATEEGAEGPQKGPNGPPALCRS